MPERGVPRGGGPHVAVADAALRPPALRAGAAQPGLHPPRREPRPPAGAAAAPPAARAPRQVGESHVASSIPPRRGEPAGLARCPERSGLCATPELPLLLYTGVTRDRIPPSLISQTAGGIIPFAGNSVLRQESGGGRGALRPSVSAWRWRRWVKPSGGAGRRSCRSLSRVAFLLLFSLRVALCKRL